MVTIAILYNIMNSQIIIFREENKLEKKRFFDIQIEAKERILTKLMTIVSGIFLSLKLLIKLVMSSYYLRNDYSSQFSLFLSKILECASLFWTDSRNSNIDLFYQFLIFFHFLVLSVSCSKQIIRYENNSLQIYGIFFGRNGIGLGLLALFGLTIFKDNETNGFSYFECVESMLMVLFLMKAFYRNNELNFMFFKKWVNFFLKVCLLKIVFIIIQALLLTLIPESRNLTLFIKFRNDIEHNYLVLNKTIFRLMLIYACYTFLSFAIEFDNLFNLSPSSALLETSKPDESMFISYFAKKIFTISRMKQNSHKNAVKIDFNFEFFKTLKENQNFKKQVKKSIKSESLLGVNIGVKFLTNFGKKLFTIFEFYRYSIIKLIADSLIVFFFSHHMFNLNVLSICFFIYTMFLIRFDSFYVTWFATWNLCLLPMILLVLLMISGLFFKKFNFSPNYFQEILLTCRIISDQASFTSENISSLINLYFKIMGFAVAYVGVIAFLKNKQQGKKIFNKRNLIDGQIPLLSNIDFNFHQFFKFILQQTLSICRVICIILVIRQCINSISIFNLLLLIVALLYFAFPTQLIFDFTCNIIFGLFVSKFLIRFFTPFFRLTDSFVVWSGMGFSNFFDFRQKVEIQPYRIESRELIQNFLFVYLIFVVRNLSQFSSIKIKIDELNTNNKYIDKVKVLLVDLIFYIKLFLKKTILFVLYFYTLNLYQTEREQKENQLNFLFIMILLALHVVILKKKGSLYNKTFISLLSIYLFYTVVSFIMIYLKILDDLGVSVVNQFDEIGKFSEKYQAVVIILSSMTVQIVITIIALQDIFTHFRQHSHFSGYVEIEDPQKKSKLLHYFLKMVSVFMKEILLFFVISKFLIRPNIFKLIYLIIYLRYFFEQFYSLGKVFSEFKFEEIFAAKIQYYRQNLLNSESRVPEIGIDLYSSNFQTLNEMYFRLFRKRIFNRIYKKVNKSWFYNFVIIFMYLVTLFYLNSEGINHNSKFMLINYFFNWKNSEANISEEYKLTLIVLVFTVCEIYFVNMLKSPSTEEEKQFIKTVPRVILFRYSYLGHDNDEKDKKDYDIYSEIPHMIKFCQELERLVGNSFDLKKSTTFLSEDSQVKNLNDYIPKKQKLLLMSYIRSKCSCLEVMLVIRKIYEKVITTPIILGVLANQFSFFDFSFFLLLRFFYSRGSFIKLVNEMNLILAILCMADYALIYSIDFDFISRIPSLHFMNREIIRFNCNPMNVLPFLIQYIALLKALFILNIIICEELLVKIDSINAAFYSKIQKQFIKTKQYYIINFDNWVNSGYMFFYKLKRNCLMIIGDFYFVLLLAFYYNDSSWLAILFFVLLVSVKLFIIFDLQKSFNDLIDEENVKYFYALSLLNFLVIFDNKLTLIDQKQELSSIDKILFVSIVIMSMLIIDCCRNPKVREEKHNISAYYRIMNQLQILNQIYTANEYRVICHTKEQIRKSYLNFLIDKKGKSLRGADQDFKMSDQDIESIFLASKRYKSYLNKQVKFWDYFLIKIKKFIRRKVFEIGTSGSNILSVISNYIEKNQKFIPSTFSIDLQKIVNGDFAEIEALINQTEENKLNIEKDIRSNYIKSIAHRVEQNEFTHVIQNNRMTLSNINLVLTSIPSTPNLSNNEAKKASKYLFGEISMNVIAHQMHEAKENNFGENFIKYRIGIDQHMVIWNFDRVKYQIRNVEFWKTDFKTNFSLILFLLGRKMEKIMNGVLVALFCFNQGFSATLYIAILIFFIAIEDRVTNLQFWKFLYLCFMFNFLVVTIIELYRQNNPKIISKTGVISSFIFFFYGNLGNKNILIIFVLMECAMSFLSQSVRWNMTVNQIENMNQVFFRLSMQKDGFFNLFYNYNQISLSHINALEFHVKKKYQEKLNERDNTVFLINLIKKKSKVYKFAKERYSICIMHIKKLISTYRSDVTFLKENNFKSFMWRNFSFPLRKKNSDYHNALMLSLFAISVYFFICYYKILRIARPVFYVFSNNEVDLTLGLNVTILLLSICVEQFVYYKTSIYWIESNTNGREIIRRHLSSLNIEPSDLKKARPVTFKTIVRKLMIIIRLKSPSKENIKDHFKHNPMISRLYFTIAFYVYNCILIFLWIPIVGNNDVSEEIFLRLFCSNNMRDGKNQVCNNIASNIFLQIYFLSVNFFCMLSVYQIKSGFSTNQHFLPFNFKKNLRVLKFYLYNYTPFIKEFKTIINYTASRSSLGLFQWFKMEDIESTIGLARATESSKKFDGKKIGKMNQKLTAFFFLGLFFFILISPLYFFSDIMLNNLVDEIKGASVTSFLEIKNSRYYFHINRGFTIDKISSKNELFLKTRKFDSLKKFDNDMFRVISFNKKSQSFLNVNKEELKKIIADNWLIEKLKIIIELKIDTESGKKFVLQFPFSVIHDTSLILLSLLSSDTCEDYNDVRMIIGPSTKLIDLREISSQGVNTISDNDYVDFSNFYKLKINCDQMSKRISFDLFGLESEGSSFLVLGMNIKNSVEILKRFSSSKISIISIYIIIFSYIGLTLIRKAFFDQTHMIWISEMPNGNRLEEYLFMIRYSRLRGNLYDEELYYNKLIDLFRAPERIKKITGSWQKSQLNNSDEKF